MKTLALFGATGRTGRHFLRYVLEDEDFQVRALVRDPEHATLKVYAANGSGDGNSNDKKTTKLGDRLTIIPGSIEDLSSVEETVEGATFIVCMLAARCSCDADYPRGFMAIFVQHLTLILNQTPAPNRPRLLLYQAGSLSTDGSGKRHWMSKLLKATKYKSILNKIDDNDQAIQFLALNCPIPYLVTRAGQLIESPVVDEEQEFNEDNSQDDEAYGNAYRTEIAGLFQSNTHAELSFTKPPMPWATLSFRSLALCTFDLLEDESIYQTCPYIIPISVPSNQDRHCC